MLVWIGNGLWRGSNSAAGKKHCELDNAENRTRDAACGPTRTILPRDLPSRPFCARPLRGRSRPAGNLLRPHEVSQNRPRSARSSYMSRPHGPDRRRGSLRALPRLLDLRRGAPTGRRDLRPSPSSPSQLPSSKPQTKTRLRPPHPPTKTLSSFPVWSDKLFMFRGVSCRKYTNESMEYCLDLVLHL